MPNKFVKLGLVPCLIILYLFPVNLGFGQEHAGNKGTDAKPDTKWSTFVRAGYVYQFDTDIENSKGSFTSDRLFIQPGITYALDHTRSFSFAIGYGYDGYNFKGETGFSASKPWDDIHTFRFSTPIRVNKGRNWSFFIVPTLRITGENGADISDSLTGGGFAGFAYRFNERFSIGPGIGIVTQIEDDASIFPVLVINWKITDRLSFETGRGIGATLGPGISLSWKLTEQFHFSLGGRFEKLRFRLDDKAETPKGIGQDESFPLFGGITYRFRSSGTISLIGGLETGGELQLEDQHGNVLEKQDYESAPFIGFSFSYRF